MEKEWELFNKKIHKDEQTSEIQTPKQTQHKSNPRTTGEGAMGTQDVEIIPATSTSEIVLRIEEIPLLDVFYSPSQKAVLKRQRKKRKLDVVAVMTPKNEPMGVIWKD